MASKDSVSRTVTVALLLSIACSVVVSTAAVALKETQARNRALDRKSNILQVAGLYSEGADVEELYAERIEPRVVDLSTGRFADVEPRTFDEREARKDPERSVRIPPERDRARIKRRAKRKIVYLVRQGEELRQVILPVRGMGLWGTMYGFLAVDQDLQTVIGLSFYEHVETPGLGGEVDNPDWKAQWKGKKIYDQDRDEVLLEVLKGQVNPGRPEAKHQVDGLSGATITTRGVTSLVQYWLGDHGYKPFLDRLRQQGLG